MPTNSKKLAAYQFKQPDYSEDIPETGDLWEKDRLGRKNAAERLVNMIAGQVGPLTIGLNGRWGEGKTFFLKRFQKMYEERKGVAVYFNAWQDDFFEDPLLSLLGQLRNSIGRLPQETLPKSAKQAVPSVLKHAGIALFKSFVKNASWDLYVSTNVQKKSKEIQNSSWQMMLSLLPFLQIIRQQVQISVMN